jgi:predicted MFS family arabinose efflux permease
MNRPSGSVVFILIVVAQFCGTSLWFAANAILPPLQALHHWPSSAVGSLTLAVQLGFIAGTFCFSLLGLADRFDGSRIFLASCVLGAGANLLMLVEPESLHLCLVSRGLTGFFLAGIYPVGMKIASDWKQEGLGLWLGALVGALVLGTAFPHILAYLPGFREPEAILMGVSVAALTGGLLVFLMIPEGPYKKSGNRFSFRSVQEVVCTLALRSPALGYFGHMWELYAFWALTPMAIQLYNSHHQTSLSQGWSFVIIGVGMIGCVAGGVISTRSGSFRVARFALIASGLCCLTSPWAFELPSYLFLMFMIFWGIMAAADSPQFSTLVARFASPHVRGTAITLVTCIGFSITLVSIQLLVHYAEDLGTLIFLLLMPGPVSGVWAMTYFKTNERV